ncbi:3-hydroxyacyl-CoA dehydrogenase [Novosphingobium aromaticivorans DSM 12444]|uniref:3-hydroxyacyl-CoA dehydrogenase n=1 Tax=Novosphingobium aromaticivorans (strain ATCC 700278 / DSM 12444 / CCUG 56034 / CIP 105152 / NBRC 16084 / F199) TaxID=279238 RepID=Q2GA09_NOVAD|nr:3-hydroxyacyl-CoA dehydrogenase [Novosphingobium aromaticivorans DSM 12444]SCX89695.1 3-hydroxyacyl-CoA dehydrogenase [Novosphingobium aromaticivorans]
MSDPIPGAKEHIDAARKLAATIDDIPADTALLPINRVGVIGAGTMGGGITMNFLTAGIPVTIVEMTQEALDRGVATMARNYENTVKRGKMDAADAQAAMARLTPTLDFGALAEADLVIEAVYESMDVKKDVFGRLDKVAKPGAILASNTSYLDIDEIASVTSRPEAVMGMHFFSPANVMKLLEVVRGKATGKAQLATVMALSVKIGKVPVVSGVCHGFIGNRMLSPRQAQAQALIMEGANYWDVDEALLEFGFPMGPWQMADLAGVDIGWHRDPSRIETLRDALCAVGRWGQKTKKGFYDYDDNRQRTPSDEVKAIIADFAKKAGKPQREIGKDEIRERLLYPMISEGALILEEGISQRASDIDTVWLNGYGWPAWTGGPMFWADHIGLDTVVAGLKKHGLPVAPLLERKAAAGETFN